jgi:hypothetical protein
MCMFRKLPTLLVLLMCVGCSASPADAFKKFAAKAVPKLKSELGFEKAGKHTVKVKKTGGVTHPYEGTIKFEATYTSDSDTLKSRNVIDVEAVYEGDGKDWERTGGSYVTKSVEILSDPNKIGRGYKEAIIGKRQSF